MPENLNFFFGVFVVTTGVPSLLVFTAYLSLDLRNAFDMTFLKVIGVLTSLNECGNEAEMLRLLTPDLDGVLVAS